MDQKKTVIIADDDREMRRQLQEQLAGTEYAVAAEAANGLELIRLCKSLRPDLVIADIQMPTMNGVEAARQILEEELARCVLMLTSFDDLSYVQESAQAGVMEYLTKPMDMKLLVPTMDRALKKSRELHLKQKELHKLERRKNSQNLLDAAKLLLMEHRGLSEEEAYLSLKKLAMRRNLTLEEAARIVVAKMRKRL